MAVMDLVPPPVAMMAISVGPGGTWRQADEVRLDRRRLWSDRSLERTVEEEKQATESRG